MLLVHRFNYSYGTGNATGRSSVRRKQTPRDSQEAYHRHHPLHSCADQRPRDKDLDDIITFLEVSTVGDGGPPSPLPLPPPPPPPLPPPPPRPPEDFLPPPPAFFFLPPLAPFLNAEYMLIPRPAPPPPALATSDALADPGDSSDADAAVGAGRKPNPKASVAVGERARKVTVTARQAAAAALLRTITTIFGRVGGLPQVSGAVLRHCCTWKACFSSEGKLLFS